MTTAIITLPLLLAGIGGPPADASRPDVVVHAGEHLLYDTTGGPVILNHLRIEEDGVLRVQGPNPFLLVAWGGVTIDGTLDLSGFAAQDVATLNTGNIPEPGGAGGPWAGAGGIGSWVVDASTPHGGRGLTPWGLGPTGGGEGGETGCSPAAADDHRRPGGGGGGALALDQPVSNIPNDPTNDGLVAEPGLHGHPLSVGAVSGTPPAAGGAAGAPVFVDGDPSNDFWGLRRDATTGQLVVGELVFPMAGRGGGAGGDACPSSQFPTPNWLPSSDEKGGAGGGGGGLGLIWSRRIEIGPQGRVRADGGGGARGENTFFLNSIGGDGGGGSGGYLVLHARRIDLTRAGQDAITALGGLGGSDLPGGGDPSLSAGGNGGPGVIQLHTPRGQGILLPPGQGLDELSSPDAHSLLSLF